MDLKRLTVHSGEFILECRLSGQADRHKLSHTKMYEPVKCQIQDV